MNVTRLPGLTPTFTRPHWAGHVVHPASLDTVIAWQFTPDKIDERPWKVSVLELVLGLLDDDSRLAEAAMDGGRVLAPSLAATPSGGDLIAAVRAWWANNAAKVDAVTLAADALLAEGGELDWMELNRRLDGLNALLGDVRVRAGLDVDSGQLADYYEGDDVVGLAAAELLLASRNGESLNRCQHCRRLFFPVERSDETYCRRIAPGRRDWRTCREVGAQATYAATIAPLDAAYRREYKRLDKRARRSLFQRAALDEWRVAARELVERGQRRGWSVERLEREFSKITPKETD